MNDFFSWLSFEGKLLHPCVSIYQKGNQPTVSHIDALSSTYRTDGGHNCVGPEKSYRSCNIQVNKQTSSQDLFSCAWYFSVT